MLIMTVCSTEFQILLIWSWKYYSNCSFWHVLVCSFWPFLSVFSLTFVRFFLLSKDAFFKLSYFFLTTWTSHITLSLVGMHSAAASIWVETKFSYLSFRVCCFKCLLKTIKFVSYSYHIFIAYISIDKWGPVETCSYDYFLFLYWLRCIFAKTILWLEDTPLKEEFAFFFMIMSILSNRALTLFESVHSFTSFLF